jgi:hypothetical protein
MCQRFCCLHHQGRRISCTQHILTDLGSGWTEEELWLHLLEKGVEVRMQRNKMGHFKSGVKRPVKEESLQ